MKKTSYKLYYITQKIGLRSNNEKVLNLYNFIDWIKLDKIMYNYLLRNNKKIEYI